MVRKVGLSPPIRASWAFGPFQSISKDIQVRYNFQTKVLVPGMRPCTVLLTTITKAYALLSRRQSVLYLSPSLYKQQLLHHPMTCNTHLHALPVGATLSLWLLQPNTEDSLCAGGREGPK